MKIAVVIPAFNEEGTVSIVLDRLFACDVASEIQEVIVVDDGSTDQTASVVQEYCRNHANPIRLITLPKNSGKGAALQAAFSVISSDVVVVQDADLEYHPKDLSALLDPIRTGVADAVFGSRFLGGGPHRVLLFWHFAGNRFLTLLTNVLNNLNLTDMETGYKAIRTTELRRIHFRSERFGFEVEFTCKVKRLGCRIFEVPVSYFGRTYGEGKKITWRDGVCAIFHLFRYRFSRI